MATEREQLLLAYSEHRDALLGYLTRQFGSPSLAEDIAQETWLRLASRNLAERVGNPRAYLFRTATNIGTDHQRHHGMGIEVQADDEVVQQIPAPGVDPARSAQSHDELRRLLGVVEELPPRCREIFILCRVDGLSHAEIAERLGIAKCTVVSQMIKALSRLEQVMT